MFKLESSLSNLSHVRVLRLAVQDAFDLMYHTLSSLHFSTMLEEIDIAGYFREEIQDDWAPMLTQLDGRMTEDLAPGLKVFAIRAQPAQDAPQSEVWLQIAPNASRRGLLQVTHEVPIPFEGWQ
jgi:hypothetical protein